MALYAQLDGQTMSLAKETVRHIDG